MKPFHSNMVYITYKHIYMCNSIPYPRNFPCFNVTRSRTAFCFDYVARKITLKSFKICHSIILFYVFISLVDRDHQNTYKIFISIISLTALDMNDLDGYIKWNYPISCYVSNPRSCQIHSLSSNSHSYFQNIIGHTTNCIIIKIHSAIYQRTVFHISYVYN